MSQSKPLKLGIAGLGTVGIGVINIVQKHAGLLAQRTGRPTEITAVSAQNKAKDRGVDLSGYEWIDNAEDMAAHDNVDCVVELIGGEDGTARTLIQSALKHKKHVVTANKALLAHHGFELAKLAEQNGVSLNYEAAVAGGIPIIKAMREGFAGNETKAVYGILNGTSNYILTQMRQHNLAFETVLKDAQDKGYAESDPTFDIDGTDAAHKICILTSLAFGTVPDFNNIYQVGVNHITPFDIAFADELGCRIKLLGITRRIKGQISQSVEPCLVHRSNPLWSVEGVHNALTVKNDFADAPFLMGRGAGQEPTASAVFSDIMDIARGISVSTFGVPSQTLKTPDFIKRDGLTAPFYIRLDVVDKPGVVADIANVLKNYDISIETMIQRARDPSEAVPLIIKTHETAYKNIAKAAADIEKLKTCVDKPCVLRILNAS